MNKENDKPYYSQEEKRIIRKLRKQSILTINFDDILSLESFTKFTNIIIRGTIKLTCRLYQNKLYILNNLKCILNSCKCIEYDIYDIENDEYLYYIIK